MNILDKDLEDCQTFSEISLWRAEKYKIDKKSGDDYTGILTNIYKEPTHFIYELLQNADDAKATNVKFILSHDKIEFFHNGSKEFSLIDIISITGVGNSSKDAQSTVAIGKFGVGFKAVFAVTDKPLIYSTTYNFQIENLSVPTEISGRNLDGFTTIFQLDFKHEGQDTLFRRNESLLRGMSPETILFLKNICKVDISIDSEHLEPISVSRKETSQSFSRIEFEREDKLTELLKFTTDGCSVVYQLSEDNIKPVLGSKISVFFPTIIDTNLPFMIDAPFQTSTTRESIDFELPHNKSIIHKFGDIFSESIEKLKSLNLFTVNVFNDIMPIEEVEDSEDFPLYKTLQSVFLEKIKTRSFVPTNHDRLLSASQILIAEDQELAELLVHIPSLNFAHKELSDNAIEFIYQTEAKNFEDIDLLDLINTGKINLEDQTDEWLYEFYEYCLKIIIEHSWSWKMRQALKETPIIKTRSGSFSAAYFNDNPSVFRPSKGIPDHRTVHSMFLTESSSVSDETKSRMKSFLTELGITERKPVIVIKEDYLRDYSDKTTDEKMKIFAAIAEIYRQSEPKDKNDIVLYLKNIAFVPSATGEFKLANKLYDSYDTDLEYLLGKSNPELFCNSIIGSNASYREFCLKLGMIYHLYVESIVDRHWNRDDFIKLYNLVGSSQEYGTSTKEYTRTDYSCSALETILSGDLSRDITSRLTHLLEKILPEQLKESFEWTYYGNKKEVIGPSILCKLLTDMSWIARDDQMIKPVDISFDDFCDLYKLPRDNVLQNLTWSNDNIIKQLSEKEQEAIKLMRELDLSPEEMHELRRTTLEKRKKSENLSKRQSMPINEQQEYVEQEEVTAGDSSNNTKDEETIIETSEDETHYASEAYEAADSESKQSVSTRIVAHSSWSNVEQEEREVLKGLVEWYKGDGYSAEQESDDKATYTMQKDSKNIKLMLLPKNNSGYNIEISEDGKITKTVAVIKTDLEKKRFSISESQWNLSKRDDVEHSFYLVARQGDRMSQIVINNLQGLIAEGKAQTIPGAIYYE